MAAYCGDGVTDDGEECDGGDTCSSDCVRIKSFGALLFDTPGIDKAAIVLSALGGAFVLAFVFRALVKRFARHVGGEKLARSIDEIPLDEIEMPWMKW